MLQSSWDHPVERPTIGQVPEELMLEIKEKSTGQLIGHLRERGEAAQDFAQVTERTDRITFRIDAYWEHWGEEPVGKSISPAKQSETFGIEPYIRKFTATEQPQELKLGDFERDQVGYLMIWNTEGTKLITNPTEEERVDIALRVATINGFELHPYGMPFLAHVPKTGSLTVQCLHGKAILQVCIFPR